MGAYLAKAPCVPQFLASASRNLPVQIRRERRGDPRSKHTQSETGTKNGFGLCGGNTDKCLLRFLGNETTPASRTGKENNRIHTAPPEVDGIPAPINGRIFGIAGEVLCCQVVQRSEAANQSIQDHPRVRLIYVDASRDIGRKIQTKGGRLAARPRIGLTGRAGSWRRMRICLRWPSNRGICHLSLFRPSFSLLVSQKSHLTIGASMQPACIVA